MLTRPGERGLPPLGPGEIHSRVSSTVTLVPAGPDSETAGGRGRLGDSGLGDADAASGAGADPIEAKEEAEVVEGDPSAFAGAR